jgi:hypothetical protein
MKAWAPFAVSLVATPILLLLGLASADVGHGGYTVAKLLFPYTLYAGEQFGSIPMPWTLFAVVQFPMYGIALTWAWVSGAFSKALLWIALVHCGIAALALAQHFGRR